MTTHPSPMKYENRFNVTGDRDLSEQILFGLFILVALLVMFLTLLLAPSVHPMIGVGGASTALIVVGLAWLVTKPHRWGK